MSNPSEADPPSFPDVDPSASELSAADTDTPRSLSHWRERGGRPARVLVAVDGSPDGRLALELAALLAAQWLEAEGDGGATAVAASSVNRLVELCGVYVEDDALRCAAALPFVHEIALHSARTRPLTLGELEPRLERIASQLRESVAAAARELSVEWSFTVRRGRMAQVSWESTGDADWVVVGGHSLGPTSSRRGPTASRISLSASHRRTDMVASRQAERPPLLVVHDGSETSSRLLEHAARLATRRGARLELFLAPSRSAAPNGTAPDSTESTHGLASAGPMASTVSFAALQRRVVAELAEARVAGVVHPLPLRTAADVLAAARSFRPQLILIPAACGLVDERSLERWVQDHDCPIALLS
ncbi:MAG: universal stress protein [Planctomycetota bacterium]